MQATQRGKPPAGTYAGKVLGPVRTEQRERKDGGSFKTGEIPIEVRGGDGPMQVDGRYDLTGLNESAQRFFESLEVGDVFVFTVYTQDGYGRLAGLKTRTELEELLARMGN
ncbi:MAG: hypothetical protein QCI38_06750 [Candidatus Thermoplasmatota archaeon]|nr:hypothetical protein [Candidatus Thermoplasmatota archaeon]